MTLKSSTCARPATRRSVCSRLRRRSARMCAPMRCTAHAGYLRHARGLDARHHAGVRDPDERPILPPLTLSVCCSTLRCVGTVSALSASARVTCTRCSMTPSARLPSGTGARRGRPPRARRHPSTPPSTVAGGGARLRYRVRDCGSRARTLRLVATPGAPAEPPVRPSTQGMLTISRPPPRRCSAACLLGSAARRLCILFAYRWLPCAHGHCCKVSNLSK